MYNLFVLSQQILTFYAIFKLNSASKFIKELNEHAITGYIEAGAYNGGPCLVSQVRLAYIAELIRHVSRVQGLAHP